MAVEKKVTLNFAKKYGWDNVRGASWCNSINF
jgi:hypothetical protein